MATDAELIAAGIHLPAGSDYISEGDDAISENARVLWGRVEDARWLRPPARTSDTLDTIPEGLSPVRSGAVADALTLPVRTVGHVEKTVLDSAVSIVTFTARRGTGVIEEYTTSTIGGVWQEWRRADAGGIVIPDAALGHVNLWGSSTPAGLASRLASSVEPYSVAVHSHARGGQWSSQTVANTSAPVPLPVQGGTIPASGSVEINAADSILDGVDLYLAPTNDGIPGWLGGIYGRLIGYGTTFTDRGIRFERDRPGSAVSLSEPPEWIADVRTPGHINIINAGKNDLTVGTPSAQAAAVIERRDALVQMWRDRGQDFLILGHFVNTGTAASATGRTWVEADNADALAKYPDNYLSMQDLTATPDVWEWTGITPTSTDLAEQALGNLPPSIAGNANHFNAAGYEWIAHNVRSWLLDNGRIGAGSAPFIRDRQLTPGGRLPTAAVEHVGELIDAAAPYVGPWRDITDLLDPAAVQSASGFRVRRNGDRIEYSIGNLRSSGTGGAILAWGSLPPGYRPSWNQYATLRWATGAACEVTANTGGGLVAAGTADGQQYRGGFAVYTTAAPPTTHPGTPA